MVVTPCSAYCSTPFADASRRPPHDEVVDDLVGHDLERAGAVARGPRVPHRLQRGAAAQPVLELGVGADREVARDHPGGHGAHLREVVGRCDEDAGDDLLVADVGRDLGDVARRQPVHDGAVTLLAREPQHAGTQRRHQDRRRLLGDHAQPEALDLERLVALGDLLAGERAPEEPQHVARVRWKACSNGIAFQRSTIAGDDAPIPSAKWPGAASAMDAAVCARSAGPRVNTGAMATPPRSVGVHAAASASDVKPSWLSASPDHTSVKPSATSSSYHSRCAWSGTPGNGTVMPKRRGTVAIGRIYASVPDRCAL